MTPIYPELALALIMLIALTLYALFGGADYGAGVWDLLARGPRAEAQRDLIAHAIGPVWEANHVWLILVLVLFFTAFPAAFEAVMTGLHVPISLMLVGVVLRGSAFTFRSYDESERGRRRWNRLFSIPSVVTPILLGSVIGAIATGRLVPGPGEATHLFSHWLGPFPIAVGLFALAIFSYLAATYLTLETSDPSLRDDFRLRALLSALAVGVLALTVYVLARSEAPLVFRGLESSRVGTIIRYAAGICAVLALLGLWRRWFALARAAAMVQVVLILWGCAMAQAPYLVPPDLTISRSAAPPRTIHLLLIALAAGAVVLLPSLVVLTRVFKSHTLGLRLGRRGPSEGPVGPP
jgi:cytochrome d ubiquinol oxidase subunit II